MNKKVLLIDSDPDSFEAVQRPLAEAGYEVIVATDGAQALEEFRRVEPDLTVVDAALSGGDGFAICQELKSSPSGNNRPILVLHDTTDCEATDLDVREASGCDEYAERPLPDDELLEICERMLEAGKSGLSTSVDKLGQAELAGALETLDSIFDIDTDDDHGEVSRACAAGDFSDLMEELADNVVSNPATEPATPAAEPATPVATAAATASAPDEAGADIDAKLDILFNSGLPDAEPAAGNVAPPTSTMANTPAAAPVERREAASPAPVAPPAIEQPKADVAQTEVLDAAESPAIEPPRAGRGKFLLAAAVVIVAIGGAAAFFLLRGGNTGDLSAGNGVGLPVEAAVATPSGVPPVAIPDAGLLLDSGASPESLTTATGNGADTDAPASSTAVADPKPDTVASRTNAADPPPRTVRRPTSTKTAKPTPVARTKPEPAKPVETTSTAVAATGRANANPPEVAASSRTRPDRQATPTTSLQPPTTAPARTTAPATATVTAPVTTPPTTRTATPSRANTNSAGSTVAEARPREPVAQPRESVATTPASASPPPATSPMESGSVGTAAPEAQIPASVASIAPAVVQSAPVAEPSLPVALARPEPAFPARALKRANGASVDLRVLVSSSGRVVRVVVKDGGNPGSELVTAAIDAVLRTKYQPAMQDGVAVKGWVDESFDF